MSQTIQRLKGTHDILPEDARLWQQAEARTRQLFESSGFGELRTPVLEYTALFARGVGEGSDIVSKEMFSFERSHRSLTLRPENTAGVVRAYLENRLHNEPKPCRLYYMGPMFRYERPQEGRQRQFHQLGVEVFGLDTPQLDAEVLALSKQLFTALGVTAPLTLKINNVGEPQQRAAFQEALKAQLEGALPDLCEDCQRRYSQNPLRMLDCKVDSCQAIYHGDAVAAFLQTYDWGAECNAAFEATLAYLDAMGIAYERDYYLVRGLDYYNRTVFEWTTTALGAQSTVCGGGRYNGLVSLLGGPDTPAVGWAIGMERLLKLVAMPSAPALDVYLVNEAATFAQAFQLATTLRASGFRVEQDSSGKAFGKQLKTASQRQARFALIMGESEQASATVAVKALASGEQQTLPIAEVSDALARLLERSASVPVGS